MKIKKIEFGITKEVDHKSTEIARNSKLIKDDEYLFFKRDFMWFLKCFFDSSFYNFYKSACNCWMVDIGPFYFTYLSEYCYKNYKKSDETKAN